MNTGLQNVPNDISGDVYNSVSFSPVNPSKSPAITLDEQFEIFNAANPEILQHLIGLARWQKTVGRKRISMKYLFEMMRYNAFLEGKAFRATNSFTSFYARMMPDDVAGMFQTRTPRRCTQVIGMSHAALPEGPSWERHQYQVSLFEMDS